MTERPLVVIERNTPHLGPPVTFQNPVLPGSHPDPSVCRVGDDFYLATSTFMWRPGLPIYHSRDLINWRLVGHAIHDFTVFGPELPDISEGLYAPTLRHQAGRFHIVCTWVDRPGRRFINFVTTATDPAGPWSAPIILEGVERIDPSLLFTDDGKIWLTANRFPVAPRPEGGSREIWLTELDAHTWQPIGPRPGIWDGGVRRAINPEGPHQYYKDGWFYLLNAEGGTELHHSLCISRSRAVEGPYEPCPNNPILTHRAMGPDAEFTCIGHGDLVQTAAGEWWLVCLGCRPHRRHSPLGRETFLVPVEWPVGDWPVINPRKGYVERSGRRPALPWTPIPPSPARDEFVDSALASEWNWLHATGSAAWSLTARPSHLRLHPAQATVQPFTVVARRQQHHEFTARTCVELDPACDDTFAAGLMLIQTQQDLLRWEVRVAPDRRGLLAQAMRVVRGETTLVASHSLPLGPVELGLTFQDGRLDLVCAPVGAPVQPVFTALAADWLSPEASGSFVGNYVGLAVARGEAGAAGAPYADFDWFTYTAISGTP